MANLRELLEGASSEVLRNLEEVTKTYISLEKIIPAVTDLLVDQSDEIRVLNKELGTCSKTASAFRGELAKIARETGISVREQLALVDATKQYHQGIQNTTKATLNFIRASGVSIDTIGELSATMTVMGNTSEESFTKMYEGILAVRDALGLTSEQVNVTAQILTKYNVITQASESRMIAAGKSAAKFVSALTSVGIKAEDVSEILDKLIDPDKLTDNIALLSKMGLTVSDLVAGDPLDNLEGATERLKQIGQEISNIAKTNRFQANALAKVYGLTLEQATKLSQLKSDSAALNTQKKLEQYRSETATFVQTLQDLKTAITGWFSIPFTWLGNIIEKFTNTLTTLPRALTGVLGVLVSKKLFTSLTNVFGRAAKKFGRDFGAGFNEYLKQVELRDKSKALDMAGLTPKKEAAKNIDYGWGYNFYYKRLQKEQELDATDKFKKTSISAGEKIEMAQVLAKELRPIINQYKSGTDKEKSFLEKRYPWLASIETGNSSIMNLINRGEEFAKGDKFSDEYLDKVAHFSSLQSSKFKNTKKVDKASVDIIRNFSDLTRERSGKTAFDLNNLVQDSKTRNKIAEIMAEHKDEGLEKTLEAIKYFLEACDDTQAPEALEKVKDALDGIQKKAEEAVNTVEFKEDYENANRALMSKPNFIDKTGALLQGSLIGIGNFFKSNITKFIRLGVVGALGGVLSSLSKNEEFQKSMQNITESVAPLIESIVTIANPFIEKIANFINSAANFFAPKIASLASKISDSVSTIENSYKQEDLRSMVLAQGVEYKRTEDKLIAIMGEAIYEIKGISKKQDISNESATLNNMMVRAT